MGHYVTKSDDEWSISLMAFNQAIGTFTPERGNFASYAALIIRSRLTDYYRSNRKYSEEFNVSPDSFDGDVEEDDPEASFKLSVAKAASVSPENRAKDEIDALNIVNGFHLGLIANKYVRMKYMLPAGARVCP